MALLINIQKAVIAGASSVVGIIVQFPFYAGILGIMSSTGLLAMIATWFVSISTPETYPLLSMLSAGIVNFCSAISWRAMGCARTYCR